MNSGTVSEVPAKAPILRLSNPNKDTPAVVKSTSKTANAGDDSSDEECEDKGGIITLT